MRMKPFWLEIWLCRREIARIRQGADRIEADIERIARTDSSPETEAELAKYRAELPITRRRIAELEENLDAIAKRVPPLFSAENMAWFALMLGLVLLVLVIFAYGVPPAFFQ